MNAIEFRRRSSPSLIRLTALATLALSACSGGDARTEQVASGMTREDALKTLGTGTAPDSGPVASPFAGDSLKNIWRRTGYFMAGRQIEILWYSPNNEKWRATDTVPEGKVIPVVLIDGKVIGVGRTVYDSVSRFYALPKNKY